uniref:Uncharacterized protein n=1 Tax=Rhizophora mucronata TaxID=61149 RepID=A0A2P2PP25_RHIMU
MRRRKKKSRG